MSKSKFSPTKLNFLFLFSIFILLASTPLVSFAQEDNSAPQNTENKSIILADIDFYNSQAIERKGNVFRISFDIKNKMDVQPQVRYGVLLTKEVMIGGIKSYVFADEKVYDEILNLSKDETLHREVEYTAPKDFSGNYKISLISKNNNGLLFASSFLTDIKLEGSVADIEILQETCYLKVEGEKNNTKYSLTQGVDINPEEILLAFCAVKNNTDKELNIVPSFKTFYRSLYGNIVENEKEENNSTLLIAGEKKEVQVKLPKASKPQAYDIKLSFNRKGTDGDSSNYAVFHYVLRGEGATIQNLILDKNYYKKGDEINFSVFWTLSADNFFGARYKEETKITNLFGTVKILDKNNNNCIEDNKFDLSGSLMDIKYSSRASAIINCANPKVIVSLYDKTGKEYDIQEYAIESDRNGNIYTSVLLGFLFIIIFLMIVYYLINKKLIKNNAALMLLLFIITFIAPSRASALTTLNTWVGGDKHGSGYSSNIAGFKEKYNPGEAILGSITTSSGGCGNGAVWYDLKVKITNNNTGGVVYGPALAPGNSFSTNAPSIPGFYTIIFYSDVSLSSAMLAVPITQSLVFEVVAPPVPEKVNHAPTDPTITCPGFSGSVCPATLEVGKSLSFHAVSTDQDVGANADTAGDDKIIYNYEWYKNNNKVAWWSNTSNASWSYPAPKDFPFDATLLGSAYSQTVGDQWTFKVKAQDWHNVGSNWAIREFTIVAPALPACTYTPGTWGTCRYIGDGDSLEERTLTANNTPCTGDITKVETRACSNRPPNPPTVTGPKSGYYDANIKIDISGADPDQDQVRYGIDQNKDGQIEEWVPPEIGGKAQYVPSGTKKVTEKKFIKDKGEAPETKSLWQKFKNIFLPESALEKSSSLFNTKVAEAQTVPPGTSSFNVYTQDINGALSAPTTYTITLADPFLDIGLRLNVGTQSAPNIVKVLVQPPDKITSPWKISKNGVTYGIVIDQSSYPGLKIQK